MRKESFIRWQSITITQLSYVVNLILGLSVASLGFQVNILLDGNLITKSWQECIIIISLISLLASVALGIFCIINRLRDFRATKEAAKLREKISLMKKLRNTEICMILWEKEPGIYFGGKLVALVWEYYSS